MTENGYIKSQFLYPLPITWTFLSLLLYISLVPEDFLIKTWTLYTHICETNAVLLYLSLFLKLVFVPTNTSQFITYVNSFPLSLAFHVFNPLTAEWVLRVRIDLTLSNARRFYSSMGNLLDGKGLSQSLCVGWVCFSLWTFRLFLEFRNLMEAPVKKNTLDGLFERYNSRVMYSRWNFQNTIVSKLNLTLSEQIQWVV